MEAEGVPGFGDRDGVGRGLSTFNDGFFSVLEGDAEVFHGNRLPMVDSHFW